MTVERGKVVPLQPRKGGRRKPPRPPRPRSTWGQAFTAARPWLLLAVLATGWFAFDNPESFEPPAFLQTGPELIAGRFTPCSQRGAYYCLVDGDTFRLGPRRVRVQGIDTAERETQCAAEAVQADASAQAMLAWLNRGSFQMTARIDEPTDRYGRELRFLKRIRPNGSEEHLAEWMIEHGGARPYGGGQRQPWC